MLSAAAITVTAYSAYQGSGFSGPGHDPSMNACTLLTLMFFSLVCSGIALTPINMANTINHYCKGIAILCRQNQGTEDGSEVYCDKAVEQLVAIGLLKSVGAYTLHIS